MNFVASSYPECQLFTSFADVADMVPISLSVAKPSHAKEDLLELTSLTIFYSPTFDFAKRST
jgi:hypothetical protein